MTAVVGLVAKIRAERDDVLELGDHAELGQRLLRDLADEARGTRPVDSEGGLWTYSPAGLWVRLDFAALSRIVQTFSGREVREKKRPLSLRAGDVNGAIRLAGHSANVKDFFASARRGIAFLNSFVEVTADAIRVLDHSPNHRARVGYAFPYEPGAKAPLFERFLAELGSEDETDHGDKILLLQEFCGASLLGVATKYQAAVVLVGDGANGKSTLIALIRSVFPVGSVVAIPPQDMGQEYRRAMLAGKLLNVVNELPEGEIIDSESFKATITGDETTGRAIREAPFTFSPIAGHLYAANRLPGTSDMSPGFWRRFVVARLNRIFAGDAANPDLAEQILATERPGIVRWMLEGAQRVMRQRRYTVPPSHLAELSAWKRAANPVHLFFDERTREPRPGEPGDTATDMYAAYRKWAEDNGFKPASSTKFGERARLLGLGSKSDGSARRHPRRLRRGADGFGSGLTGATSGENREDSRG